MRSVLNQFGVLLLSLCLPLPGLALDYLSELNERYAPYADWEAHLERDCFDAAPKAEAWWRCPKTIRERSGAEQEPSFDGLHLALDPGHIGGDWAETEGRHFRINPGDYYVREGELVLEVARLVKAALVQRGAQVTLLREKNGPLNPRPPKSYFKEATQRVALPKHISWASMVQYGQALRKVMNRMSVISGELLERARIVNEEIRPDALISLHINAAPWPVGEDGQPRYELVDSNHSHVLIFGCLSDTELSDPLQREQLVTKMTNGSGATERKLGQALGLAIGRRTGLPPSFYGGKNATRLHGCTPYLWARNLMLLRYVRCPTVLLEPYIANSPQTYSRIQEALRNRETNSPLADNDILVEYANAVVEGLLSAYGSIGN